MFYIPLSQPCPNIHLGFFLPADLRHIRLILILGWNLVHRWRAQIRPSEFFLGPGKFLVASEYGSKGKTLPADCEQLERPTNLKLCRELHTINKGPRNFIQLNFSLLLFKNFRKKSEISHFLWFAYRVAKKSDNIWPLFHCNKGHRLTLFFGHPVLTIFFRFQARWKIKNWVFIDFYKIFMKFTSEVTRSGHGCIK
jgi:hypothetical protein